MMEMPSNKTGKTAAKAGLEGKSFEHVEFEMLVRHPSGEVKSAVKY